MLTKIKFAPGIDKQDTAVGADGRWVDSDNVRFIDVSDTNCKSKLTTGGWHGITLTKCFADKDPKRKEITKYLEEIF